MLRLVLVLLLLAPPVAASSMPEALALASAARRQAGLPSLTQDNRLAAAAEVQARYMAGRQRIGHDGPGGSHFSQRIRATGFPLCYGAENVAGGQVDARNVTYDWMASPGHRANILNPHLTRGAVAAVRDARGRLWWAMVLAGPC